MATNDMVVAENFVKPTNISSGGAGSQCREAGLSAKRTVTLLTRLINDYRIISIALQHTR